MTLVQYSTTVLCMFIHNTVVLCVYVLFMCIRIRVFMCIVYVYDFCSTFLISTYQVIFKIYFCLKQPEFYRWHMARVQYNTTALCMFIHNTAVLCVYVLFICMCICMFMFIAYAYMYVYTQYYCVCVLCMFIPPCSIFPKID